MQYHILKESCREKTEALISVFSCMVLAPETQRQVLWEREGGWMIRAANEVLTTIVDMRSNMDGFSNYFGEASDQNLEDLEKMYVFAEAVKNDNGTNMARAHEAAIQYSRRFL